MKLKRFVHWSFLVIGMIGVSVFHSCTQEDVLTSASPNEGINELDFESGEIETLFNQTTRIFDESGKFFVEVNVGSNNKDILEYALNETNFKLNMIFEDPDEQKMNEGPGAEGLFSNQIDQVEISYTKLNLDPRAIGFYIKVEKKESIVPDNGRVAGYSYILYYRSPKWWHDGKVTRTHSSNTNADVHVKWYYKKGSLCCWKPWNSYILTYTGDYTSISYSEYKIGAAVSSNWKNYNVYWKKWQEDAWELDNDPDTKDPF